MSTRMQQRRGTAAQWISTNSGNGPILAAGEIGFESDTNKFKIGDGINHWVDLTYFTDAEGALAEITALIDGAPAALDTLNELAAAIGDDPNFVTTIATNLSNHESDTTSVHGIADTSELATKSFAASLLTGATKSNITITGDKNGLTITAENGVGDSTTTDLTEGTNLYFTNERAQDAVGNTVGTGLSYNDSTGAISVDTTAIQARVTDVSDTEIGYLNGVTSGIQSQIDSKAALAGATFTGVVSTTDTTASSSTTTGALKSAGGLGVAGDAYIGGDLIISGDFTVSGTTTTVDTANLNVTDAMIYMGDGNSANLLDLGIVSAFDDGTYQHTGLVRDSSDGKWKLFKGVTDEPTTTVNFAQGSLDDIAVGGLTATSITVGDVSNTEFGYLNGVTSAIQTQLNAKAPLESPTFTGTVSGITKSMVGLGDVENTALSTWAGSTNITTLGTIATGTWSGTEIGTTKGGTGLTSYTSGDILYASGSNTLAKLAKGSDGQVLTLASGVPAWSTPAASGPTVIEIVMGVYA